MMISIPSNEEISRLPPDGGPKYNRLIHQKSPYLLQHAGNPVDWYPWGEEAFTAALQEDKAIFLSIGYSTCHWCHVMEHECFEDPEVAELLNAHYIAIKVDREERPDIDQVYMTATQALTGQGGWPMSLFLTPQKKPFFAGTYFPKQGKYGRPGFMELLPQISLAWREQRKELLEDSDKITRHLQSYSRQSAGNEEIDRHLPDYAYGELTERFDDEYGGFGSSPKFPTPHVLSFLLHYWKRSGKEEALKMVEKTVMAMRNGGVYDQLGFGIHRYSTDRYWLLPHFEKMLYDQAMMLSLTAELYQATQKARYAAISREIASYVLEQMTSPEGAFYAAEDADSEGEEGSFYLWTTKELSELLDQDEYQLCSEVFGILPDGNYLDQSTGKKTGKNILHYQKTSHEIAEEEGLSLAETENRIESIRRKLEAARRRREKPFKDDKILCGWNGLMTAALAKAGRVLHEYSYISAAETALDFVLVQMRRKNGRLQKRYRGGESGLEAHLDDYAAVAWACLEVYEADFETRYLRTAIELADTMLNSFWDLDNGGFFMTSEDGEELIFRSKESFDGALPSGNSIAADILVRLFHLTSREKYRSKLEALFSSFSGSLKQNPTAMCHLLSALDFFFGPATEVVLVGDIDKQDSRKMLQVLRESFIPHMVVLYRPASEHEAEITEIAAYTLNQNTVQDKATAYLCRDFTCRRPTTDPEELRAMLRQ